MDNMKEFLQDLRVEYASSPLDDGSVAASPFDQFNVWFEEAQRAEVESLNAMNLATADSNGRVSSRLVLLKDISPAGLTFYTNYDSRKGQDLAQNPRAAIAFYWVELGRQVLVRGDVAKTSSQDSDEYFAKRPRESQISAAISPQSSAVPSRQELEKRVEELDAQIGDGIIPRPDEWGGYLLAPDHFEFWQARANRLHDRMHYLLNEGVWTVERLAP